MLRIAVPNKGSLSEAACEMLHEAGYRQRKDRELVVVDPEHGAELFFLRPRDIAVYVGSGRLDIGITGRDLLLDSRAEAEEILALGFGRSTFRFAGRPGTGSTVEDLKGRRIATSYPGIVRAHLDRAGVDGRGGPARRRGGDPDPARRRGRDRGRGLHRHDPAPGRARADRLADPRVGGGGDPAPRHGARPGADQFLRRLQGVLVARKYVLMDYDIRAERLREAVALTPGLESPTVSPLHSEGWVAVRAMVPRGQTQRIMDDLWAIGARAILVTDIRRAACKTAASE